MSGIFQWKHSLIILSKKRLYDQKRLTSSNCVGTRTHNHLVPNQTFNHLPKLVSFGKHLSDGLFKWLRVGILLQSLNSQISRLLGAMSSFTFRECMFFAFFIQQSTEHAFAFLNLYVYQDPTSSLWVYILKCCGITILRRNYQTNARQLGKTELSKSYSFQWKKENCQDT